MEERHPRLVLLQALELLGLSRSAVVLVGEVHELLLVKEAVLCRLHERMLVAGRRRGRDGLLCLRNERDLVLAQLGLTLVAREPLLEGRTLAVVLPVLRGFAEGRSLDAPPVGEQRVDRLLELLGAAFRFPPADGRDIALEAGYGPLRAAARALGLAELGLQRGVVVQQVIPSRVEGCQLAVDVPHLRRTFVEVGGQEGSLLVVEGVDLGREVENLLTGIVGHLDGLGSDGWGHAGFLLVNVATLLCPKDKQV